MDLKQVCDALVSGSKVRTKFKGQVGEVRGVTFSEVCAGELRAHVVLDGAPATTWVYEARGIELLSDYEARIEAERAERARKVFAGVADGLKPRGLRVLIHKLPGGANVSPSIRGSIEAVTALGKAVVVIEPLRKMSEDVELLLYPADRLHEFMDLDATPSEG